MAFEDKKARMRKCCEHCGSNSFTYADYERWRICNNCEYSSYDSGNGYVFMGWRVHEEVFDSPNQKKKDGGNNSKANSEDEEDDDVKTNSKTSSAKTKAKGRRFRNRKPSAPSSSSKKLERSDSIPQLDNMTKNNNDKADQYILNEMKVDLDKVLSTIRSDLKLRRRSFVNFRKFNIESTKLIDAFLNKHFGSSSYEIQKKKNNTSYEIIYHISDEDIQTLLD